ncbi:MAG: redox-sensing transcriptional repressor Rex [Candidatus Scatovivens sp.]
MEDIHISQATLKRLPQYLRIIKENQDIDYISSTFIAQELKLNPIQVRKDLALISKTDGKPGTGFLVKKIMKELEEFLGLNNVNDAIIVGAGKLGQALLNYQGFKKNLNVLMAFDIDNEKCNNKNIFNINKMRDLIKRMNIKIRNNYCS